MLKLDCPFGLNKRPQLRNKHRTLGNISWDAIVKILILSLQQKALSLLKQGNTNNISEQLCKRRSLEVTIFVMKQVNWPIEIFPFKT